MRRAELFAPAIVAVGVVLAGVQVVQGYQQSTNLLVVFVDAGPYALVSLTLTYTGYWLITAEEEFDVERVAVWALGGAVLFAAVAALQLFSRNVTVGTIDRAVYVATDLVTLGTVVGVLVGLYDARGRDRLAELERQREQVEEFATKAADVNHYGRALNQSADLTEVAALCIQAMQALLGVTRSGLVLVREDDCELINSTLELSEDVVDAAAREARGGTPAEATVDGDRDGADGALVSLLVADDPDRAVVLLAVASDADFDDTDVQLTELLVSHAGTAIAGLEATDLSPEAD